MALTGLPTQQGIDILNSDLKTGVQRYVLVGFQDKNQTFTYSDQTTLADIQANIAGKFDISRSFYDENGVLTFECPLAKDWIPDPSLSYIYAVGLLYVDSAGNETLVSIAETPIFEKLQGIGGNIIYKVPISGEPLAPVFSNLPYITEYDLMNLFLPAETSPLWDAIHTLALQVQALAQEINELKGG